MCFLSVSCFGACMFCAKDGFGFCVFGLQYFLGLCFVVIFTSDFVHVNILLAIFLEFFFQAHLNVYL